MLGCYRKKPCQEGTRSRTAAVTSYYIVLSRELLPSRIPATLDATSQYDLSPTPRAGCGSG